MATTGRYLYAIRIEGVGNDAAATASNKLYRWAWSRNFFDAPSTSDPDSLYVSGGPLLRWPRELEFSVDFRRGEPTLGSLQFELRRTSDVLTHFWAGTPSVTAKFNGAVTATATSVVLDTASLGTPTLYAGREAIKLGSESPSKTYAITRTRLETSQQPHSDGAQLWASMHPTSMAGRVVELLRVPLGSTGYGDEEVRWIGVLRRVYAAGTTSVTIEVDNALALLRATRIYRNPWRQINGDPVPSRSFRAGYGVSTATQRALVVIDDKHAEVVSYTTSTIGGSVVAGEVAHDVRIRFGGSPPAPPLDDLGAFEVREFFSTDTQAPANNATPAVNTLPLQRDPGLLINTLLLTGTGDATYDLDIEELAGGIPPALVDATAFVRRGAIQEPLEGFHVGHKGNDPIDLYELIQDILCARGAALTQTNGGKISVVAWADATPYNVANTISQGQVLSTGSDLVQDRKLETVLELVEIEYNDRVGIGTDSLSAHDVVNQRLVPRGEHDGLTLRAPGLTDRAHVTTLLQAFVSRFHEPLIEYGLETLRTADFWPGDVVALTHAKLWAGAAQGLTAAACLVSGRRERLDESGHAIHYRLLYVGEILGAVGYIAPSGEVASYAANVITLETNTFTVATDPHIASDAAGFVDGDKIQIVDEFGTVRDADVTVDSVGGDDLKISGHSVTPAPGDVVLPAAYDTAVSTQQAAWAFVAEADGTLNGDTAKDWTS